MGWIVMAHIRVIYITFLLVPLLFHYKNILDDGFSEDFLPILDSYFNNPISTIRHKIKRSVIPG